MIVADTGSEAARKRAAAVPRPGGSARLDGWPGFGGGALACADPLAVIEGHLFRDAGLLRRTWAEHAAGLPRGGLLGWVGFEGGFRFGLFPEFESVPALAPPPRPGPALFFEPQMSRVDYVRMVRRAQEYITAGDIYQVNLSYPWVAEWSAGLEPADFYARVLRDSPAPHAAFIDLGGTQVFSASPECFLRLEGRRILTRPIKGTRPRGAAGAEDRALAAELRGSAKERAELVMITDLERNDLGQVCEFGSVRVTELLGMESHPQVHHLVSTVEGVLRRDVDHLAAFLACFPGGSISGAPKRRALEIIRELEGPGRGLYTGAIGYFGFDGRSQFSIAIRTAWREGSAVRFHTGAGIVADSVPDLEYDETQHKAAGLLRAARGA